MELLNSFTLLNLQVWVIFLTFIFTFIFVRPRQGRPPTAGGRKSDTDMSNTYGTSMWGSSKGRISIFNKKNIDYQNYSGGRIAEWRLFPPSPLGPLKVSSYVSAWVFPPTSKNEQPIVCFIVTHVYTYTFALCLLSIRSWLVQ